MTGKSELTKEQLAFLEECNLEFSERYTDADLEYKKVYDAGIPPPPIVYPWWIKARRFLRDRQSGGGGRYSDGHRDYREENHRRPGSSSWYGDGDYANRGEAHRRHSDNYGGRINDYRVESQRGPGSYSRYNAGDGTYNEGRRQYRDGNRAHHQDDNAPPQNQHRPKLFKPY